MSLDRSRRDRFTYTAPKTGEVAIGFGVVGVLIVVITPLVVQAIAAWATSGSFALPNGHLLEAYSGLLGGRFGAGLPSAVAAVLPSDTVMWVLTLVGEVLVICAVVVVGMWLRDIHGIGSQHGLATPTQASEALGFPRLRSSAAVIRPDLYGRADSEKEGRKR